MTQLSSSRYRKLGVASPEYGKSYGLYWDTTLSQLCIVMNDGVVARVDTTGVTADLEYSGEARGDIVRRGASAWEKHSAKTAGYVLAGDGTDVKSLQVSGDATIAADGALTVTDVTVGSDAAGDLLYKSSATALARLAKGALGQFLQMNAGATAPEWDTMAQKWSYRCPAASGKDTDFYKGGIAGCAVTGDLTATEAAATYCQNYDLSATAYRAIEAAADGDFVQWQIFPSNTQDNDACYFGHTIPFCEIWIDMSATVATYTGNALTWEYYNGSTWAALTLAHDYTDATAQNGLRSFGRDGAVSFIPPSNWASTSVNSVAGYWVRARVSTVGSLGAARGVLNSKRHYLVTPTDGFVVPHAATITGISIRDEAATLHAAAAIVFELVNFTTGAHSGALTFAQSKRNDNFAGLTLAVAAGDVLGVLISTEDGTNEAGPFTLEITASLV